MAPRQNITAQDNIELLRQVWGEKRLYDKVMMIGDGYPLFGFGNSIQNLRPTPFWQHSQSILLFIPCKLPIDTLLSDCFYGITD